MSQPVLKPFDRAAYEQTDAPAREAVRGKLDNMGIHTMSSETFGVDITALHPIGHEVEVKRVWKDEWPESWETIHIPFRKTKLFKNGQRVFFWILRSDCKEAWVIDSKMLNQSMLVEIPNTEISKGEYFYNVPVKKASRVNL